MSLWGVPVVNYEALFLALFPYAWCYFRERRDGGKEEGRKAGFFLVLIPVILVIELRMGNCKPCLFRRAWGAFHCQPVLQAVLRMDDLPVEVFITSCSLVLGIMLLNPLSCP
jgi:hypothetical protein